MRTSTLAILCLLISAFMHGQLNYSNHITINTGIGDEGFGGIISMVKTPDNGYICTGSASNGTSLNPLDPTLMDETENETYLFISKYNEDDEYVWHVPILATENSVFEIGGIIKLVCNSEGSIYAFGVVDGAVDLDPTDSDYIIGEGSFSENFIVKYSANGEFQWANSFTPDVNAAGYTDILVNEQDELLVFGIFSENTNINITGEEEIFPEFISSLIIKYDDQGEFLEYKTLSNPASLASFFSTFDLEGNIIFYGPTHTVPFFSEQVIIGDNEEILNPTSINDQVVVKLDSDLNVMWAGLIEVPEDDSYFSARYLDIDDQNNIYVSGYLEGAVDLDHLETEAYHESNNGIGSFILKLNEDGQHIWSNSYSNQDDFSFVGNMVKEGKVLLPFTTYDDISFTEDVFYESTEVINGILELDTNGEYVNSYIYHTDSEENLAQISASLKRENSIKISGIYAGEIDVDFSEESTLLNPSSGIDIFIATYSTAPVGVNDYLSYNSQCNAYFHEGQLHILSQESHLGSEFKLYDLMGKELYSSLISYTSDSHSIQLKTGMYILKIQGEKQSLKIVAK